MPNLSFYCRRRAYPSGSTPGGAQRALRWVTGPDAWRTTLQRLVDYLDGTCFSKPPWLLVSADGAPRVEKIWIHCCGSYAMYDRRTCVHHSCTQQAMRATRSASCGRYMPRSIDTRLLNLHIHSALGRGGPPVLGRLPPGYPVVQADAVLINFELSYGGAKAPHKAVVTRAKTSRPRRS